MRKHALIMGRKKKKRKLKRDPLIMGRKKKSELKRDTDMMVMELDPDILLEIFCLLPIKKAAQCRFVCKSWRTLLDDDFLMNIHAKSVLKLDGYDHHHHASSSSTIVSFIYYSYLKDASLFGFYDDNLCSYKEISFYDSSSELLEDATMINSCNGLICLNTNYYSNPIAIYNPVTTEILRVPWLGGHYIHGGFGYHPSTKEYKILGIIGKYGPYGSTSNCHRIYTLGTTGRWKNIKKPPFDYDDVPGVHVNGALYWIIENRKYGVLKLAGTMEREMIIMSFDLADEEYRILTTMLPPSLMNNMKPKPHCKLVESQGCLFLFTVDQYSSPDYPHIELWVMKEKENGNDHDHDNGYRYYWSNLMKISTHGHDEYEFLADDDYEFLTLTQSGKVLFWHTNDVLTCFDPKTERFTLVSDVPASSRRNCTPESAIVPHTNSLVSLIALGAIPKKKKIRR